MQTLQNERNKFEENSKLQFDDFNKTIIKLEGRIHENEEAAAKVARLQSALDYSKANIKDSDAKIENEKEGKRLLEKELLVEQGKRARLQKKCWN